MADATILEVHPVLMARNVAESAAWYRRLGFETIFVDDRVAPRYAAVRRGPVELHLQWADASQWEHAGDRPAFRFLCGSADQIYAEFLQNQAGVGKEGPWASPADTPWGTREFHVRDPAGNVLQFYQPRST